MSLSHADLPLSATAPHGAHWHLFCRVIDNWGDIGVTWRLASELAQRGQRVTLWVDDSSALSWLAPQGAYGVAVKDWSLASSRLHADGAQSGLFAATDVHGVVVEMFGCELPESVQQQISRSAIPVAWINLEYLSAERHISRLHGLPSPVMGGPAAGCTKWFFYPGFSLQTGGIMHPRHAPCEAQSTLHGQSTQADCSLFCYDSPALAQWVTAWQRDGLHVATYPGAGARAIQALGLTGITLWDAVAQPEFDNRLTRCAFNVVRGEDSMSRALWSGRPFLWHIYPQDDGVHRAKLDAFLDWTEAPLAVRRAHGIWNGFETAESGDWVPTPQRADWHTWVKWAEGVRARSLRLPDLTPTLMAFASDKDARGPRHSN